MYIYQLHKFTAAPILYELCVCVSIGCSANTWVLRMILIPFFCAPPKLFIMLIWL